MQSDFVHQGQIKFCQDLGDSVHIEQSYSNESTSNLLSRAIHEGLITIKNFKGSACVKQNIIINPCSAVARGEFSQNNCSQG